MWVGSSANPMGRGTGVPFLTRELCRVSNADLSPDFTEARYCYIDRATLEGVTRANFHGFPPRKDERGPALVDCKYIENFEKKTRTDQTTTKVALAGGIRRD